jgi:hypothetical protein
MAFNIRPKSEKDIKDLKLKKEKVIIELFKAMQANFGKLQDEFITIDADTEKVKILRSFEKMIDLNAYKKLYPGITLSFGDGTKPSSTGPTTQEQELITLKIFEELLSRKSKNYKSFGEMIKEILVIYPKLTKGSDWYKSFELQFNEIDKTTHLPNNKFDVFNRDKGFMDYISKLVNSKFGISKKDSWNPADIWLIKSSEYKKYEKKLDEANTIVEVNGILKYAFENNDIVGISLKKTNGKELHYELVNLESNTKLPDVNIITYKVNIEFDKKKKSFKNVTSTLVITDGTSNYNLGIKSNQASIGNITYEFTGKGAAAHLGKVPKDMLKAILKENNFKMPEHKDFKEFDRKFWETRIKKIKTAKFIDFTGNINDFIDNMEMSWSKGREKDNVIVSQIMQFVYILSTFSNKKLKEIIKDFYYLAQKKGEKFGPFGKLY